MSHTTFREAKEAPTDSAYDLLVTIDTLKEMESAIEVACNDEALIFSSIPDLKVMRGKQ